MTTRNYLRHHRNTNVLPLKDENNKKDSTVRNCSEIKKERKEKNSF